MRHLLIALLAVAIVNGPALASIVAAEECCEPGSPFMLGETFPETPATCENIEHWASRGPEVEARVTMTIAGKLTAIHSDGILAYLVMCEEGSMQVLCVTYSTEGRELGESVLLAGGYMGPSGKLVLLDPCLASPWSPQTDDQ